MILGYIAPHLIKENIGLLIQCDMSKEMLAMSKEVPDIEVCPLIQHWVISEYFTHKYLSLYLRSWAAEFYPKSEWTGFDVHVRWILKNQSNFRTRTSIINIIFPNVENKSANVPNVEIKLLLTSAFIFVSEFIFEPREFISTFGNSGLQEFIFEFREFILGIREFIFLIF